MYIYIYEYIYICCHRNELVAFKCSGDIQPSEEPSNARIYTHFICCFDFKNINP